jgi:hypothetical protein
MEESKKELTYYELYHKAAIQATVAYKHLMLGNPVVFMFEMSEALKLSVSGSILYWKQ